MRQLLLDFTQAPAPTFENFVHGGNSEVLHALEGAARGELAERVLYIWGESGAGKTHLLKAFAAAGPRARYVASSEASFDRLDPAASLSGRIALDDLERLPEAEQGALFNAFNEGAFSFLLVAARAAPRDVRIRRDLATRLATGLTYRVMPLTDEEKRSALAAHARSRGFALSEEVSAYLLSHVRRDMGSLMATLDALDRYSLETGRPVTVPLLKAAMQPPLDMRP
jgi:DnaA family protein